jgi:hypothetical protein
MLVCVEELPERPLEAAARFYGDVPARVEDVLVEQGTDSPLTQLLLVFPPADHTHRAWRLAAVQELARRHAPVRVNAVASDDEAAIAAAERYLASAPGVTGQYLPLDSHGAE